MIIYGVAILAACQLAGLFVGDLLGFLVGVKSNVGGVGFAMLMLIFLSDWMRQRGHMPHMTEQGVLFWSAMYIPIVVAMAAGQNVVAALSGGWIAVAAGAGATALCMALVPVVARIGGKEVALPASDASEV